MIDEVFVLAGGQSRRFGSDKTLYPIRGKPAISFLIENILPVCRRVVVVAKDTEKFRFIEKVELVEDLMEEQMVLAGVYTALKEARGKKVVILCADMPLVKPHLLLYLWEMSHDHLVTIFKVGGKLYPFPGVYPVKTLPHVERFIREGDRRLTKLLEQVGYITIPTTHVLSIDPLMQSFFNMNTPSSLHLLEMLLKWLQ
ncbi:Molybdopterin-guanine dinucleotide biosynthesis protein A-like protein [Thermocrinis albus DSM 14484]|uniref:Probable molybdenum cofactor guanylyltransferase n=1 Tax=Thermocrinis albus (strain DSM 14484 / JCM 11386 / HI 11/12) TaxID=638303 RepID=D3SPC2_THEAH|nr:molybdenum cofactor guanylyltransferase MobA [Thermocrinis albus]ADC89009.1 Molybdopterin-guanine dinucleotide biosynthesis protein A-like protein [Thermocrinis albus DSM 14484]